MDRWIHPLLRPFGLSNGPRHKAGNGRKPAFLSVETLECREVLSNYAFLPNRWPTKTRLTYSLPSDGVYWFKSTNVMQASLDNALGANWRTTVAEAVYQWSSVSDLDIAQVPDGAFAGDYYVSPAASAPFGDIRIGGYDFANSQILASTFGPPPDGWSRAGDISVNVGVNWNLGSNIDLRTVILHEVGHSLGLDHPSDTQSIMYESYQGVRPTLAAGDIAGIQALYGARRDDSYTLAGIGVSAANPISLAAPALGERATALGGIELAAAGAADYFRIDVPEGFVGTSLKMTVSANAISMLSPALSLVGADGSTIRSASAAGQWGSTVTIDLGPVLAGQSFVFKVNSAESNRFAIGGYRVQADFAGGQVPQPTPPAPTPEPTPVTPPPVVIVPPVTPPAPVTPPQTTPVTPPVTTPTVPKRFRPLRKLPAPIRAPVNKPKPVVKTPAIKKPVTAPVAAKPKTSLSALAKVLLAKK
ncbi:matrixin family metalloprotease [bacterium]|nr:matrixin family metalloprotease [bacterium]